MSKNLAVIEQNVKYTTDKGKQREGEPQPRNMIKTRKCFLIVDTKLVEDEPYEACKIAEFLGLLINDVSIIIFSGYVNSHKIYVYFFK
jgi:hypothetical protein